MAKTSWLIVGLGNPGSKYANTRHNIGWMVVDALAKKHGKNITTGSYIYNIATVNIKNTELKIVQPTTYMNASGEAVLKLAEMYDIEDDKIVVICDEYNFPVGKIHLRFSGGDGGHNGVASVIEELDSREFFRLRCGIGKDFVSGGMVDYVLSNFREEESEDLEEMIKKSIEALEHLVHTDKGRAMSDVNSGSLWKPKEVKKKPKEEEEKETE